MSDDEKVGYKSPPKGSRFKPGQSGNPNGRPKGAKNKRTQSYIDRVADIVIAEAHREIKVKENGETVSVEVIEAVMRSVVASALKGVAKSQKLMFEVLDAASRHKDERRDALLEAVLKYKERCQLEIERAKSEGRQPPDMVPHPNDLVVDPETGDVDLVGPLTYQQRAREDLERVEGFEREIDLLETELKAAKERKSDPDELKAIRKDIKQAREFLDKFRELYENGLKSEKADWTFKAL